MQIKNEDGLRWAFRKIFPAERGFLIRWIEPAWGSTTGIPDAELSNGDDRLPVELKYWFMTEKGVEAKMRPMQRQYHKLEAMNNRKSLIMFALCRQKFAEVDIYILPGRYAPMEKHPPKLLLHALQIWSGIDRGSRGLEHTPWNIACDNFCRAITGERFWL